MNGVPFQILATSMIRYNMVSRMKAKQAVTMINDTDLKKKNKKNKQTTLFGFKFDYFI